MENLLLCSLSKSHGSVSLSNVPGPNSMMMPDESYKENIPNLSFSLNPPPSPPSISKETKPKDEGKVKPVESYGE